MSVKQLTSDYVDRAGTDGIHDVKRAKTWYGKSLWIVLLLFAWFMVVLQVYSHINKYFSYPINTNVELKFDDASTFPAVTICNLNPVRVSQVTQLLEIAEELEPILKQKPPPKHNMVKGGWEQTRTNRSEDEDDYDYDEHELTESKWSSDQHPNEILLQDSFYNHYFKLDESQKWDMGHDLDDMLLECTWKEQQCSPDDFSHFLHPTFGNCYTFNAGWKDKGEGGKYSNRTIKKTNMPGPSEGLSVQLFAQGDQYLPLLAGSTGVRVLIHSQGAPPHPEDTGFTTAAGFATTLEIRKVEIKRLPLPYNSEDCKYTFTQFESEIAALWPTASYTMTTCMKLCYQRELLKECKCVDPEEYFLGDHKSVQPCNMSSETNGFCKRKFDARFRSDTANSICLSDCPQPCNEMDYEVQISSAQWPNQYYLDILKDTALARSDQFKELAGGGPIMQPEETTPENVNVVNRDINLSNLPPTGTRPPNESRELPRGNFTNSNSTHERMGPRNSTTGPPEQTDDTTRQPTERVSPTNLNVQPTGDSNPSMQPSGGPSAPNPNVQPTGDSNSPESPSPPGGGGNDNDDQIRRNVLKLDVYYQSLNYKLIFEEEAYVLVDLLADIGGAVDLWVGMSVLAAVQLVEFFIEILFFLCCSNRQTKASVAAAENRKTGIDDISMVYQPPPSIVH